jgi:hypothetical protein
VLAAVALLGAVSFYAWGQRGIAGEATTTVDASTATKVAAPVAPATASATATRVSVALQATPAEAKLYLDDEPLASNPTTKLLLNDGKAHVLRAEAPGFANATSEFSPTKDSTVALTLTPVDRAAKANDSSSSSSPSHRSYIRFGRPAAGTAPVAAAPVAAAPAAAPTPAPAAAAPAKPDCSNPIFLDKDGIRRVRPECR